jgi:hypothetical protein
MEKAMIKIIYENSKVLKGTDTYEEKEEHQNGVPGIESEDDDSYDSDTYDEVLERFKDINVIGIYGDSHSFGNLEELINTLNVFFRYEMSLYDELLEHFINEYVIVLTCNPSILRKLYPKVQENIEKMIGTGLYDYIFNGNDSNLIPEDIFVSLQLFEDSYNSFQLKDFTPKVVARGLARSNKGDIYKILQLIKKYGIRVDHEKNIKEALLKDNVALFDYSFSKFPSKNNTMGDIFYRSVYETRIPSTDYAGSIKCLMYLHEKGSPFLGETPYERSNLIEFCYKLVALGCHLECMKYMHKEGFPMDESSTYRAARGGHLEYLKYLHEKGCPWHLETTALAARNGHLECLAYAYNNGCNLHRTTTYEASESGHWDCMMYAHTRGCQLEPETCNHAARRGSLKYMIYALENGGELDDKTCSNAAKGGNIDCLKYAYERGCVLPDNICESAITGGSLECLKYTHGKGFLLKKNACTHAIQYGHLDCLKYLHKNKVRWYVETCSWAALGGRLECLMYLHENGCRWNKDTCSEAARGGHLECLKYAHENGCPWDKRVYKSLDHKIIRYARLNDCPE